MIMHTGQARLQPRLSEAELDVFLVRRFAFWVGGSLEGGIIKGKE